MKKAKLKFFDFIRIIMSFLILLPLVFSFVSCGKSDCGSDILSKLQTPFEYTVTSDDFTFTYTKTADKTTICVIKPETLSGLMLEKTSSGIVASYDGLVVTLPTAAAKRLFRADELVEKITEGIENKSCISGEENGICFVKVPDGAVTYIIYYDTEAGKITEGVRIEGEEKLLFGFQ